MRSAFDKLISGAGLVLAAVLLIGGGLLTWANVYIGNQVDDQLSMQGITMPEGDALAALPEDDAAALEQFAGSPLDTGPEARAYADHYILAHMNAASDGRTYQEVSGEYLALSGAAFATMGTIAGIGAIVAFAGSAILLLLVVLGLRHSRRADATPGQVAPERVPQPA